MKLTSLEQVQKRVGMLPAPRDLKVIDHVDGHARRWLSHCSFGFIAFCKAGTIQLTPAGGARGFVSAPDPRRLQVPLAALDDAGLVAPGASFGALFMVSGMDETLRVNGKVAGVTDGHAVLQVEECYLHCAKSFRRAGFWLPGQMAAFTGGTADFVQKATFLVVASMNSRGQADVSPKGDPEGFLLQEHDGSVVFADRPGNRRIDSFRNVLEQPAVAIMALVPGCKHLLEIGGIAEIRAEEDWLQRFEVQGKAPKLALKVAVASMQIKPSVAIEHAALWPAQAGPEELVPSEIFKAHIRQSNEDSLQAKVVRAAVSLPGAMEKGLELDYKKNMY